jgi:hypothetical protein
MKKQLLTLALVSGSTISGNALAQNTVQLNELMKCNGWSERAIKNDQYFLENFMYEGLEEEDKKYRTQLQAFKKAFKQKHEPNKEEWENDSTYFPIDKANSIFESVTFYGNYGMGFHYRAKLKPTVNVIQLKSAIEVRDGFKFKEYSKGDLDQYAVTLKLAEKKQTSEYKTDVARKRAEKEAEELYSIVEKNYPWIGMVIDEPFKVNKMYAFGKQIKNNTDFSTYIGIEEKFSGKTVGKYIVCGVGEYQI